MRLAQISGRTLDALDLSRAEARVEARAGRLWASSPRDVAIAPDEEAARWALETVAVERVECSTQPEEILWDLREAVRRSRALSRRLVQVEGSSWDPETGVLTLAVSARTDRLSAALRQR